MAAARRPVTLLRPLQVQPRCFSSAAETPLQRSVRSAIESGDFVCIPRLLLSYSPNPNPNPENSSPNPFSFLSHLPPTLAARLVGDLLFSFLPLRPRSVPVPALSSLLLSLLNNPNTNLSVSLSLSLAVLQPLLRSGLPPPPLARLALPRLWLRTRSRPIDVAGLLSSLPALGLRPPDLPTLNYLLSSLPPAEAVAVLRGMPAAGIDPDRESYCTVIEASPAAEAEVLLREMVAGKGMAPRRGTAARVVAKMGREGEARRAAALLRWLEREGVAVGFEAYEAAAEACVRDGEAVTAGRVVAEMAARGFAPYAGVRRRVVEALAGIGQAELASAVRLRLAAIGA